jgi:hypothetical protein
MTASAQAKPPPAPAPAVGKLAAPAKDTPASRMRKVNKCVVCILAAVSCLPMRQPGAVRRTLRLLETRLSEVGVTPGAQTRQVAAALLGLPAPPPRGPQPHARPGISTAGEPAQPLPPRPPGDLGSPPKPRYHNPRSTPAARARTAPRAITSRHQPAADHPAQGKGRPARDPAGVPLRQLVRIPSGIPADTGIPAPRQTPGSGRSGPSGGLPD